MARQILDVTRPISNHLPVWPGDPPVVIERIADNPAVSRISMSSHAGTHIDPPAHFFPDGITVDQLPLDLLVGPAWLVRFSGPGPITATMLESADIPAGVTRLLICTRNSDGPVITAFDEQFVALAPDAAQWVIARGVRLVGIDGPGIGPYAEDVSTAVHLSLLEAGVIPLEGLNLAGVTPGAYELMCLPLALADGDGAPARVLLQRDARPV
jgi:arylformamidase